METNCDFGKILGDILTVVMERQQTSPAGAFQTDNVVPAFDVVVTLKQSAENEFHFCLISLIFLLTGYFLGYLTPFFGKVLERMINYFQIPVCDSPNAQNKENVVKSQGSEEHLAENNSENNKNIVAMPDSPLVIKPESTDEKISDSREATIPYDKSASEGYYSRRRESSIEDEPYESSQSKSQKSNESEGRNSMEDEIVRLSDTAKSLFDFQIANKNPTKNQFREAIILHQNESEVDKREIGFRTRIIEKDDVIVKIEIETRQITYKKDASTKIKETIKQKLRDFGGSNEGSFTNDYGYLAIEEEKKEDNSQPEGQIVPKRREERNNLEVHAWGNPFNAKEMYSPIMSPVTITIPFDTEKEFPHLNGFFENVFGKKEIIGKGGFGEVYKALHKLEQKFYAVKKIKLFLKQNQDLRQNKLFREVAAMTSLSHKNVVRHHTTWTEQPELRQILPAVNKKEIFALNDDSPMQSHVRSDPSSDMGFEWDVESKPKSEQIKDLSVDSSQSSIEESSDPLTSGQGQLVQYKGGMASTRLIELYIQMEYCSGKSLSSYLKNRKKAPKRKEMLDMFKQILEGVVYIHSKGIMHRDLKPSNIFLESKSIKIGDFGLSWLDESVIDEEKKRCEYKGENYTSNIGTPLYVSPEQEKSSNYDQKTDVYSLGVIFFEMLNNFSTEHERVMIMNDFRRKKIIPAEIMEKFSQESLLMLSMIDNNPKLRPSASEALAEIERIIANKAN